MDAISPRAFILMKVGYHGKEDIEEIVIRKTRELSTCGVCYWGYGGTLCHPIQCIQPFLSTISGDPPEVDVFFVLTKSPYHADSPDAAEYSLDGKDWHSLPPLARVSASRFALVLGSLEPIDEKLDLTRFEVAYGPSKQQNLATYFRGRVDKAIAVPSTNSRELPVTSVEIRFRARLVPPHAILLRP